MARPYVAAVSVETEDAGSEDNGTSMLEVRAKSERLARAKVLQYAVGLWPDAKLGIECISRIKNGGTPCNSDIVYYGTRCGSLLICNDDDGVTVLDTTTNKEIGKVDLTIEAKKALSVVPSLKPVTKEVKKQVHTGYTKALVSPLTDTIMLDIAEDDQVYNYTTSKSLATLKTIDEDDDATKS